MTVTILDSIQVKWPIHWSNDLVDKLQNLQQDGEKAKETLIVSNLRLVIDNSWNYFNKGLIPLEDAIQEGNIGLIKAVRKFERFRHLKFSTFATRWINQAIQRSIQNTESHIRLPVGIHEQYTRIQRATAAFQQQQGRSPTVEEIAKLLEDSPEKIEAILAAKARSKPDSLDRPLPNEPAQEDDSPTFMSTAIACTQEQSPEGALERKDLQERVRNIIDRLPDPRHRIYLSSVSFGDRKDQKTLQKDLAPRLGFNTQQGVSLLGKKARQAFKELAQKDPGLWPLIQEEFG